MRLRVEFADKKTRLLRKFGLATLFRDPAESHTLCIMHRMRPHLPVQLLGMRRVRAIPRQIVRSYIPGILRYYPEAGFRVVGYASPADGVLQVPADSWLALGGGFQQVVARR